MATVTRTYLDKRERKRLGWFLWIIVPFCFIGPVMAWAGQASLFYLFAVCWQHYHIAKQHMGFMMLWKAKNKERDPLDLKLDRWFMLSSTVLPLALFVIKTRLMACAGRAIPGMGGHRALMLIFALIYVVHQVQKFRVRPAIECAQADAAGGVGAAAMDRVSVCRQFWRRRNTARGNYARPVSLIPISSSDVVP